MGVAGIRHRGRRDRRARIRRLAVLGGIVIVRRQGIGRGAITSIVISMHRRLLVSFLRHDGLWNQQ
jgi:hypothetical protein